MLLTGCYQYRFRGAAEEPYDFEIFRRHEEFLFAGTRALYVYGREYAPLRELAVEVEFHVAGALKFFVYHVIHTAAGIYQRRRKDGQATAFLYVARRTEEPLGLVERGRIHTAAECPP